MTGAAGGIGRALVAALEAEGAEVRGLDLVDGFDVTDPQAWLDVEPADVVCLNAGVLAKGDGTIDDYRRILGVNVDGVVFGVQALTPRMSPGSVFVVTASLAGLIPMESDPLYVLTKHAVVGYARSMAPVLEPRGIRINLVCPGIVRTPMTGACAGRARRRRLSADGAGADRRRPSCVAAHSEETGQAWVCQPGREPLQVQVPERPRPEGRGRRRHGAAAVKLGLQLGYDDPIGGVAMAQEADRLGFHSVWTSEAWGADAVTMASWIAATTEQIGIGTAIMQMPARTPAMTAMTVATLDQLSGGRVLLGLGTSGPQVVEGWHGVAWGKPLGRTREYVEIVRAALRRETVEHHGAHYDIPYSGEDATGLGKPLKLILKPLRRDVPIYLAAIGPKNVALAAEIADGWLPIFFSPYRFREIHGPSLEGAPDDFQVAPMCPVLVGDDVQQCRDMLKPMLALYIGGMGAKGKNFYNSLTQRYGFEEAAAKIQELYLSGMKGEAAMTVPDELVDEIALVGPKERIAERLEAWREAGISTLVIQARQQEALEVMAELLL